MRVIGGGGLYVGAGYGRINTVFTKTILVVAQLIENEMTILCIIVLKFDTCTLLKIATYCNISPQLNIGRNL